MFLSVIVPAYNEEKRIEKTLLAIDSYLSKQVFDYEILVVDDGSKDATINIVRKLENRVKNLSFIENSINHGKGWVVRQGMLKARGEVRLFTDADSSTSIEQMENLLPYFKDGYDVVIGSRRVPGAVINVHQPFYKEFLGRLGNLWIRIFAIGGISDTQAGFKALTAEAAEIVFPRLTLHRWGFDFEMLAIARLHKLKIKEVPIVWVNDVMSHVKLSAYIKTLFEALRVRLNLIEGVYK